MLIVSKFHDYYDTAAVYGIDKTVVYKRQTESFEQNNQVIPFYSTLSVERDQLKGSYHVIGFCGNLYPMINLKRETFGVVQTIYDLFFYSADEIIDHLRKEGATFAKRSWWSGDNLKTEKGIRDFFNVKRSSYKGFHSLFLDHKQPVFSISYRKKVISPILKDLRFMKVKDATSAHQEIYQYISGVLGTPANPIIEIADKYKQQQHGHDHKYSFRREPRNKK